MINTFAEFIKYFQLNVGNKKTFINFTEQLINFGVLLSNKQIAAL